MTETIAYVGIGAFMALGVLLWGWLIANDELRFDFEDR
jgi:hypothetical protein